MIVIETKRLTKIYTHDFIDIEHGRLRFNFMRKTVALENLDLEVREGEIFGLLGPNGAGKSTTIKILMGILFPSSGSAKLMGKPLGDKSVKAKIGFLPENAYFYDYLKGQEFLDYYGQLYGLSKSVRRRRIDELEWRYLLRTHLLRERSRVVPSQCVGHDADLTQSPFWQARSAG